jgi:lipoprotein signal peptidase
VSDSFLVSLRLTLAAFVGALAVDLVTKAFWVARGSELGVHVVYNTHPAELARRLTMCAVAVAVTAALARLAAWRGVGRVRGAWIGAGVLAGGVVGNGISPLLWHRGVPDFVYLGAWVWNVADFEISFGLVGGLASIFVSALLAYGRARLRAA